MLRTVKAGQIGYYLPAPEPGRWTGTGTTVLRLDGEVDARGLGAVLGGCQPDGTLLLGRLPARRRCGFDAILAAPKSVSVLAAMADAEPRSRIEAAHHQAVEAALSYLERHATWTRRKGEQVATDGLIAASFNHRWSAAADPHLHTHLVVANLVRGDGVWSTLDSRALFRHARAAGGVYQASLRHAVAERGLHFQWDIRPSGLADIGGVPRAAIDACSRRQGQVTDEVEAGLAGRRGRATAGARTRAAAGTGPEGQWDARSAAAGFDRADAAVLVARAGTRARTPAPVAPTRSAIEAVVAERSSRFERQDVVHAVARLSVAGATGPQIERWADDFLTAAVALERRTWTTPGLRQVEQRTVAMATRTGSNKTGLARSTTVDAVLGRCGHLTDADQSAVRRLTTGGAPVELLGSGSLIGQSWVLDAARAAWEASGHRVAVLSLTERAAARWQAVAGIGPPPTAPAHATVLIVDGVDRWPASALHRVLADGEARNAKVVLIDGGTSPARRRPLNPAVETLRSRMPLIDCGSRAPDAVRLPAPGPVVRAGRDQTVAVVPAGPAAMAQIVDDWAAARARLARDGPPAAVTGPPDRERTTAPAAPRGPVAPTTGAEPATPVAVVAPAAPAAPATPTAVVAPATPVAPVAPVMVALGPEEAAFLNAAARARLQADGRLSGPAIEAAGRQYQAGDEVRALRRDAGLGSVPGGTVGVVKSVDESRGQLVVQWPGREVSLTSGELAAAPLTHAYATTPAYLRGPTSAPALCLGDPRSVTTAISADLIVQVVGPASPVQACLAVEPLARLCPERDAAPAGRRAELDAAVDWRRRALGVAAETRPSRAVLEELGPRPTGPDGQRAWRHAAQAIEVYRDRWSVPDQRLDLASVTRGPDRSSRQLADALGVITGCRTLVQSQDRSLTR